MRIVIVGNGVAGTEAALALRARLDDADITVVSEESRRFFARTALLYVVAGQQRLRETEPYERPFIDAQRFRLVSGRARALDGSARVLVVDDERIPFDRLLLACGSRPRRLGVPGESSIGVGHFVTLSDLAWLHEELHGAPLEVDDVRVASSAPGSPYATRPSAARRRGRAADTIVVVGGGLIGIELVEAALAAKKRVHFVVREEWYWPMAIDAREGAFIARALARHGCVVHMGAHVSRILDDDDGVVRGVEIVSRAAKSEVACDAVAVAVGVQPNTAWLEGSALSLDERGGIVVDERLATAVSGVFAAGDCASVPDGEGGRSVMQLWYTARDQGRVAGRAMAGDDARYTRGTWYNSAKLMDVEFTTVGRLDARGDDVRDWFYEEQGRVESTLRVVERSGAVVGVNVLGRRVDHEVLLAFIDARLDARELVSRIGEARFDTEFVPRLVIPKSAWPEPRGR